MLLKRTSDPNEIRLIKEAREQIHTVNKYIQEQVDRNNTGYHILKIQDKFDNKLPVIFLL